MKRIALLTTLAMGFSTAAIAQPRVVLRAEAPSADVNITWNRERYQGRNHSHWRRDNRHRWTPLATGYNARTQRQFIKVNNQGRYRKLRIESVRGEPVILKVAIEFGNGTSQGVEYNESFPRGTGEVIDLNGDTRRISRIIVYTDPNSRGAYSVYGT